MGAEDQKLVALLADVVLDEAMKDQTGIDMAGTNLQLANGTWRFYDYGSTPVMGIPGQTQVYASLSESDLHMIIFAGALSGVDTASIMQNNLR